MALSVGVCWEAITFRSVDLQCPPECSLVPLAILYITNVICSDTEVGRRNRSTLWGAQNANTPWSAGILLHFEEWFLSSWVALSSISSNQVFTYCFSSNSIIFNRTGFIFNLIVCFKGADTNTMRRCFPINWSKVLEILPGIGEHVTIFFSSLYAQHLSSQSACLSSAIWVNIS